MTNTKWLFKADDYFAEIGFILDTKETDVEDEIILYRNGGQILELNRDETYFYIDDPKSYKIYNIPNFTFSLFERVKPIVEKKRKEVGWDK